jgi:hypothetical protein
MAFPVELLRRDEVVQNVLRLLLPDLQVHVVRTSIVRVRIQNLDFVIVEKESICEIRTVVKLFYGKI